MSRAKGFLALCLLAAAVALVFLPRGRRPADDATTARSIALYGYDEAGDPLWEIRAEDGRIDESTQTLSGVTVDFHGDDGSAMRIRGDRLERSGDVSRLSGNVRIDQDDLHMEVEAVTWDEAVERLESGPIVLETQDVRVSAAGFAYDLQAETASFTGGVEASAGANPGWTIRSDRAEEHDGVVVFRDGVTADSEDGHLSAESVRLDEDGMRATGRVAAQLNLREMGELDDT
jgi:hypothetical protein